MNTNPDKSLLKVRVPRILTLLSLLSPASKFLYLRIIYKKYIIKSLRGGETDGIVSLLRVRSGGKIVNNLVSERSLQCTLNEFKIRELGTENGEMK